MSAKERRRRDHQDAVGYLCVNGASLNAMIADPAWREQVGAVTAAEPGTEPWYTAVRRLHEIAEDAGVPGGLGLTTPMGHGWPPAAPRVAGWVCPADACTRVELAAESPAAPRCDLLGRPLRLVAG